MKSQILGKKVDHFFRIPYVYYSNKLLENVCRDSWIYMGHIYKMYAGIYNPNGARLGYFDRYWYHQKYVIWVFEKAQAELKKRDKYKPALQHTIPPEYRMVPSKPIKDFIPPNGMALATDTVLMFEWYEMASNLQGGKKLPISYINHAKQYYQDWSPPKNTLIRIDYDSIIDPRMELGFFE